MTSLHPEMADHGAVVALQRDLVETEIAAQRMVNRVWAIIAGALICLMGAAFLVFEPVQVLTVIKYTIFGHVFVGHQLVRGTAELRNLLADHAKQSTVGAHA